MILSLEQKTEMIVDGVNDLIAENASLRDANARLLQTRKLNEESLKDFRLGNRMATGIRSELDRLTSIDEALAEIKATRCSGVESDNSIGEYVNWAMLDYILEKY